MSLSGDRKEEIESKIKNISELLHIVDILARNSRMKCPADKKQRAAFGARALVNSPKLILADEPTGALDSKSSAMLLRTLQIMNRESRCDHFNGDA